MTPSEPQRVLNRGGLRLIDGESGQVLSEQRKHSYEDLVEINAGLKRKLEGAVLQIGRLEKELADKHLAEESADDVRMVLEYWREKCHPRAKVVPGSPRWAKVRERLKEGYSTQDLGDAVRGALLSKYHVDNGYLKAETIFRDSGTVDDHRERFEKWTLTPRGMEWHFDRVQRWWRERGNDKLADAHLAQYLQDKLEAERGMAA